MDGACVNAVHENDKTLVSNIIRTMRMSSERGEIQCSTMPAGYRIELWLPAKSDNDVTFKYDDFNVIFSVGLARIQNMGITVASSTHRVCLWVLVSKHDAPVLVETIDVLRIKKRKTWRDSLMQGLGWT